MARFLNGSYKPVANRDALPNLPDSMRQRLVAAYAAYCVAMQDVTFNVRPRENIGRALSRMMCEAIEGVNIDAIDIKEGKRILTLELDDTPQPRTATLNIEGITSLKDSSVARALTQAYQKASGKRPKTVAEALAVKLG